MKSRRRARTASTGRWTYALLALGAVALTLFMIAPQVLTAWVRAQLKTDAFRARMESLFGDKLEAEVTLAQLRWSGDEVTAADARLHLANGWRADLDGLRLGLDWSAFRQKSWRIIGAGAESLELVFDPTTQRPVEPAAADEAPPSSGSSMPGWLRAWLPDKTEVDGARIERLALRHPAGWHVVGTAIKTSPWLQGDASLQIQAEGGVITTPLRLAAQVEPVKLRLDSAALRLGPVESHLKEARLHWLDSPINARGRLHMQDQTWSLATDFERVPLSEVLAEDWRVRLSGQIAGEMELSGRPDAEPRLQGSLKLKDGALTTLPILERLALYTRVERFKRLTLDIAEANVDATPSTQVFENIVLQSIGLMRLEGRLTIRGEELDGTFMLGVIPETLRWMPGTQKHVFTLPNPNGPTGMVWTPLRITGTLSAPREDLSARILEGAGRAALDAPGEVAAKAGELLLSPVLGKDAAAQPGEILKNATEAGGKALDTGARLLEGIGGGLLKP